MNTHSGQLERWLGSDAEFFSRAMRGWYGPPIPLAGVPGDVYACGDGDFTGRIKGGSEATLQCYMREQWRRRPTIAQLPQAGGFATLADVQTSGKNGRRETVLFNKSISNPALAGRFAGSFRRATTPAAGSAAAAAPGGTQYTSATAGAAYFLNALSGQKSYITGGYIIDLTGSGIGPCLIHDRLFSVAKTMSSTGTEAVTGVPTRYQSTTATDPDYAAGNFVYLDVVSTLGNTAHNWTVCQYTNQAGAATQSFPSFAGQALFATDALDHPNFNWFMPLAAGDTGVLALTQMQCDASVTGSLEFTIGHPLTWFPSFATTYPFAIDGIRSAFNLARVFDDACLSFLYLTSLNATNTIQGYFDIISG